MQEYITKDERATLQAFAQGQMKRDNVSDQEITLSMAVTRLDPLGYTTQKISGAVEWSAERAPTATAFVVAFGKAIDVDKLDNFDPNVAKGKSKPDLVVEAIVGATGLSTLAAGGIAKLAENLGEKLATRYGAAAGAEAMGALPALVKTLTTEHGTQVMADLVKELKVLGPGARVAAVEALTAIEKLVPEEGGKKLLAEALELANGKSELGSDVRDMQARDNRVHSNEGANHEPRVQTGKLIGVYTVNGEPTYAVMHTTDDRYVKLEPKDWGAGGLPKPGSVITVGHGAASNAVGQCNAEIVAYNKSHPGAAIAQVKDVEMSDPNHPPAKGSGGTAIVTDHAVFVNKGNGNFVMGMKDDPGFADIKTGDRVVFGAQSIPQVVEHDQSQVHAAAQAR